MKQKNSARNKRVDTKDRDFNLFDWCNESYWSYLRETQNIMMHEINDFKTEKMLLSNWWDIKELKF